MPTDLTLTYPARPSVEEAFDPLAQALPGLVFAITNRDAKNKNRALTPHEAIRGLASATASLCLLYNVSFSEISQAMQRALEQPSQHTSNTTYNKIH